MCANNECIPAARLCNEIADCTDNSDESTICKGMEYKKVYRVTNAGRYIQYHSLHKKILILRCSSTIT